MQMAKIMHYRVYFNRRGAPKGQIWCVDRGEGKRRRFFALVMVTGFAVTRYSGREPDWKNPVAWMEVEGRLKIRKTARGKQAEIA
jgi:hypothetical protein